MPQKLRTNPPPGTYHSMKLTAGSGGVTAGDWIKVGNVVGYVFNTAAEGAEYVLVYVCEKIMAPKITGAGSAFVKTDAVYFDATLTTVTPTQAGGLYRIGVATEDADDDATEVEIDLEGKLPLVEV
jgi:predicted RecA/RadA family phage recombinase